MGSGVRCAPNLLSPFHKKGTYWLAENPSFIIILNSLVYILYCIYKELLNFYFVLDTFYFLHLLAVAEPENRKVKKLLNIQGCLNGGKDLNMQHGPYPTFF